MRTTHDRPIVDQPDHVVVTRDAGYRDVEVADGVTQVSRIVALITAGIVLILGMMAMARLDWNDAQLDAPVVSVADMLYTPAIAVGTAIIGVLLLGVAASRFGDGRVVMGALMVAVGAVILLVDEVQASWSVEEGHGWFALLVGAVFLVTGFLTDGRRVIGRRSTYIESVR